MIIGEASKAEMMNVNPAKAKQLTNVRAVGKEENLTLTPPRKVRAGALLTAGPHIARQTLSGSPALADVAGGGDGVVSDHFP
jgi:hypothetical protein